MMNGSGMFFGGGFMWLIWILVIVGIVLAVVFLVRGGEGTSTRSDSALDILKKRYARGEIDEEEYERRRRELEQE